MLKDTVPGSSRSQQRPQAFLCHDATATAGGRAPSTKQSTLQCITWEVE